MGSSDLKQILKQLPKNPGVYIYKDNIEKVIYIGKAKNLFNRVNSYFTGKKDSKTTALLKKINSIEYFVTNSETEALLLENNLIKIHKPKYNIDLKDSKSYPYIKITDENLPRIYKTRSKTEKGTFFGPYVNANLTVSTISTLRRILQLRTCKKIFKKPYNYSPCLNYHINLCCAPCASKITEEEYLNRIKLAKEFIQGKVAPLIKQLEALMEESSVNMNFEKAAFYRDEIRNLNQLKQDQNMVNENPNNSDYIGIYRDYEIAALSVIIERNGSVIDKKNYIIQNSIDTGEILTEFMSDFYLNNTLLPDKVFLTSIDNELDTLSAAVECKFGRKIKFILPTTQKDKRLTKLAADNAELHYEQKKLKLEKIHHLRELKNILKLKTIPRIIECFDIATLNGKFNTAAMTVLSDGIPDKSKYRQFNIEGEGHPDDYAMMKEVIARRYQRLLAEKRELPDLIVVDGGMGQLNAAVEIKNILKFEIPIIGIAKKEELLYVEWKKQPIKLPEDSYALKIIQTVRDESHRMSNSRLRSRYSRENLKTVLTKIEGIGSKKALLILKTLKSVKAVKSAKLEDLINIEGIGADLAKKIFEFFHR